MRGGGREGEGEEGSKGGKDKLVIRIKAGAVKHAPARFKDAWNRHMQDSSHHVWVGRFTVVIDIGRREAVVSHTAGHEISQDLWGVWSVKTEVIKLGEE